MSLRRRRAFGLIVGIALVNPAVMPQPEMEELLRPMMEAGETTFDAIGSDIAR